MDYRWLYENNADFRAYVDRYARKHGQGTCSPVENVLKEKLVHEVGNYYLSLLEG